MGVRKDDPNWNPRARNQGNPNPRGLQRDAGVVPSQASSVLSPRFFGARYVLGAPIRPASIQFDNGFLDKFGKRSPTASDYVALAKWKAKLGVAEELRPDLVDALQAYRHFLEGRGRPRTFSYERYVLNDESGRVTLANAMLDIQDGVEEIWETNKLELMGSLKVFSVTGGQISCGSDSLFPYPATENWQKAIGGHIVWLSGNVTVSKQDDGVWFALDMTLHAEDRYNFNPGQKDIATGIPDSDNGIFEITGLGNQFDQTAELRRIIKWKLGTLAKSGSASVNRPRR
ncbi:MAG: hypothetical protein JNM60_10225 [Candidatus Competibacteraceae bacterium]|nr:hypothetical protein [Candidatus Competibacteraceae bacterium]